MTAITTFDSTKEALLDLLTGIKSGKTQLPDFQRGWIWDDERVRSLLASIAQQALLERIEKAMGKPISRESLELDEDEPDNDELEEEAAA